MRRVKRDEVRFDTWIKPDPLDLCLDCWAQWLAADADKNLGAKTLRLMCGNTDGYGRDPGEEEQERTLKIGAATDAMIDSLSHLHRWAVYEMCGVSTTWRFPNANLLVVGPEAREELIKKLKKNCCTGALF